MASGGQTVPIWPAEFREKPRRMVFLFGEPRWYIWLQQEDKQPLSTLRRDLLLLHQNGDLQRFKGKKPVPNGTYITALYEGRMIRGCVSRPSVRTETEPSKVIHALDIDEGRVLKLPSSQIRALPECALELPAQAVRCDLGLDCEEQFKWPKQLDGMLHKVLQDATLVVQFKAVRPGSIPTISADVSLCNEAVGVVVKIQDWLRDFFSKHLELCSLEKYKPFPVGTATHNEQAHLPSDMINVFPYQMLQLPFMSHPFLQPGYLQMFQQNQALGPSLTLPQTPPGFGVPMTPSLSISAANSVNSLAHQNCFNDPQTPKVVDVTPLEERSQWQKSDKNENIILDLGCDDVPKMAKGRFNQGSCSSSSSCIEIDLSTPSDSMERLDPLGPINFESVPRKMNISSRRPSLSRPVVAEAPSVATKNASVSQSCKSEMLNKKSEGSMLSKTTVEQPRSRGLPDSTSASPDAVPQDMHNSLSSSGSTSSLNAFAKPFVPKFDILGPTAQLSCEDESASPGGKDHVVLQEVTRDWKQGTVVSGIVSHIWDPHIFEVNIADEYAERLIELEAEMNRLYKDTRIAFSSKELTKKSVGEYCAFYYKEDNSWVRGQVHEWKSEEKESPVIIWSVDYGGRYEVDFHYIQPLVGKLACSLPILATICAMKNVRPRLPPFEDRWPPEHLAVFKELMQVGQLYYLRIDGPLDNTCCWPVSVFTDSECSMESINEMLVERKCAFYVHVLPEAQAASSGLNAEKIKEEEWDPMAEAYRLAGHDYSVDDEDACLAVSGRKPTEEAGICWFFQKNKYCYKKMCLLRHEELDPDGWTKEKGVIYTSSLIQLEYPQQGEQVELQITHIMNVHHFIAIVHRCEEDMPVTRDTLPSLLDQLNKSSTRKALQSFATVLPAPGEIVLAEDKEGKLYRGRILWEADDLELYQVLNVDTGRVDWVNVRKLWQMDTGFLYLPFQAVECMLADVAPVHSEKAIVETCMAEFAEMVKRRRMRALVYNVLPWWGLEVVMWNSEGNDIAQVLTELGMLKESRRTFSPGENSKVPG